MFAGSDGSFPVIQDGKEVKFTINEVEQLMGLPIHYTDCANLPPSRRYTLLGRGWCVPTVAALLSPLIEIFMTKEVVM